MVNRCVEALATVGGRLRLMFQDEGRFGRISNPRRCWAPRGMRPSVPAQMVREYTYAYAAVSPHDGIMDSLILPEASERAMSIFLREVSDRHAEDFILMVMDGAGWHKAQALKVPDNMALMFLPPYSPELNPVEHIWGSIRKDDFSNAVFNSMEAVEDQLMRSLATLEKDTAKVASMTGFPWIIGINLNAT
ncbi:MAG: IS630 family transposase [Syntrophobacteraceae bacterium]